MLTNVTGNKQSTPGSPSNQDRAAQIAAARQRVVKYAVIATLIIYLSNLGLAAGIHFTQNNDPTEWNAYWLTVLIGYSGGILAGWWAS